MSARRKPGLPVVRSKDPALNKFMDAAREVFNVWRGDLGDRLDRVVTFRDFANGGNFGNLGVLNGLTVLPGTPLGDATPPPAPTNLVAAAAFNSIILTWDGVARGDLAHYEIWRNTTNTLDGSEVRIATTVAETFADPVGHVNTQYCYWVRAVTTYPKTGPFNATLGTCATTDYIQGADFASTIQPVMISSFLPADNTNGDILFLTTDSKVYRWNGLGWTSSVQLGSAVDWTNITNVTVSSDGFTLTKSGSDGWDAGASSATNRQSGDVMLQFSQDSSVGIRAIGLSNADTGVGFLSDILFAWVVSTVGLVPAIYESGTVKYIHPTVAAVGDVYTVRYKGGAVEYLLNDVVVYTSASSPTYPVYVDAQIYGGAATISGIVWTGTSDIDFSSQKLVRGQIAAGAISADNILANSIIAGKIAAGAVSTDELAANVITVGSGKIANGAIENAQIGDLAVDTAKIANGAIVEAKIGDAEITNAKIGATIQSTSYDPTNGVGWKIDKAGDITAAALTLYDANGNIIMQSGGSGSVYKNYLNTNDWSLDITPADWQDLNVLAGSSGESVFGYAIGPFGEPVVLWNCVPTGVAGGADGGWYANRRNIDVGKTYRFTVWVLRTGTSDGGTYFGPWPNAGSTSISNLGTGDSANTDPYFLTNWDPPTYSKWYLLVGYVHPADHTGTTSYGGIYDPTNGSLVAALTDFKWMAAGGDGTCGHRCFFWNCATSSNRQWMWDPRFELINGSEISVNQLLAGGSPSGRNQITSSNISTYIANLAVDTLQIAGNAVTVPVAAKGYQAHGTAIATYASWTTCCTTSAWNSSGNDVQIHTSLVLSFYATGNVYIQIQVERWNGATWVNIWNPGTQTIYSHLASQYHFPLVTSWVDSPGVVTGLKYRLRITKIFGTVDVRFETSFLGAMEVKK